jgi:hypothetical protein
VLINSSPEYSIITVRDGCASVPASAGMDRVNDHEYMRQNGGEAS